MNETTLTSEIRALTGVTSSQISDTDIHLLIGLALNEYSYYNPNVNFTASSGFITTVDNQPNYDFPTGALWIIEVFWSPDSDAWSDQELRTYEDFLLGFDAAHPVDLSIYYRQLSSMRRYFSGKWKVINGDIWLMPPPNSAGQKVALLYATARTLLTMADVKDFLFKRLVSAYILQRRGTDLIQNSGWQAGAYRVSNMVGSAMIKKADEEILEVRQLLAQSYGAITDYTISKPFGIRQ